MTEALLRPTTVQGEAVAPPSKSYTHRFLIAAHLAGRAGRIRRPLFSDDTLRTARALRRLGSRVELGKELWRVSPAEPPPVRGTPSIDCGESGTTLRLVSAVAALQAHRYRFLGRGRLPHRPMGPLFEALRDLGAEVVRPVGPACLPFDVRGPIHGGDVEVAVDESSQFTSALLLALPTVEPSSRLRTVGAPVSEPYVRATIAVAHAQGVRISTGAGSYRTSGGQRYRPVDATVPGDASSAAYLWASAAVSGGRASVDGVPTEWPQADLAALDLLRRYGAVVRRTGSRVTVRGERRRPFRVHLTAAPDLYPLAGVLAAAAPGRSYLLGAEHVVAKESDRRAETARLVRAMGARVTDAEGGLAIEGTLRPKPIRLRGVHDHRIVMSAAVAATVASGPSGIEDARAVDKSFPGFFRTLQGLGVEVSLR